MAAYTDDNERATVQALAYDIMELSTICAALATTLKGKMSTTIRTQSKMAADNSGNSPAIFYTATQGEETIWMGPSIESHVTAGRYTMVVLCTDGGASTVRNQTGLSVQDFTAARDREMVAALARLGLDESQIMVEHLGDGQLSVRSAEMIISKYAKMFPGASHKTTSWRAGSTQAAALGFALNNIAQNRATIGMTDIQAIQDARFYLTYNSNTSGLANPQTVSGTQKTLDALAEYSVNDPSQGRYAISQRSNPEAYAKAQNQNSVRIHNSMPIATM